MTWVLNLANRRIPLIAFAVGMLAHAVTSEAHTFKVLHSFSAGLDGCYPAAGLIVDGSGNLYGTTAGGESCNCGTVFELPHGGAESPLYDFTCGDNGEEPIDTLLMDQSGNLYGSTIDGGSIGCGVVFEFKSTGHERTVHAFAGSPNDGCGAEGTLIADAKRNLYGTASGGGIYDEGAVIEIAPSGSVTLLHSFKLGRRGNSPLAGVIMDAARNLYGTNGFGGAHDSGNVFQLTPGGSAKVLYTFKGSPNDGREPRAGLIMDTSRNLFGVTYYGGDAGCAANLGCGVVFKLAPDGTETVLHFFSGKIGDGANPFGGLIADGAGNLYGTTEYGGGDNACNGTYGCGTVFEIARDGTESILHKFKESTDGANPAAGLVADSAGNLYGTAKFGGANGYGTVFEITP